MAEGLLVDDWVRGGPGDLARVANEGIGYAFGQCVETRAQLRWMREWNAAAYLRRLPAHPQDSALWVVPGLDLAAPPEERFAAPGW